MAKILDARVCQNPECGKTFTPLRNVARFCCDACATRTRAREKQRAKADVRAAIQCEGPGCTNTMIRNPSGIRAHNFCCRACRVAWRQANQPINICAHCGKEFRPHFTKPDQQYCGPVCSSTAGHEKARAVKEQRLACLAQIGDRDMAAETVAQVPYSSLWRGKGMLPTYSPLLNSDVYVGY